MSETAELAQNFLPVFIGAARRLLPWLWDRIFPAYGAHLCPKPYVHVKEPVLQSLYEYKASTASNQDKAVLELDVKAHVHSIPVFERSIPIGWPVLLVVALIGVIIGVGLGLTLLRRPPFRGRTSWGSSFLFFGFMNLGAIGYHCLPGQLSAFYVLDVVGTACSSFSIVCGWLALRGTIDDRSAQTRRAMLLGYCTTFVVVGGAKILGISIICEMAYLVSMHLAGVAVFSLIFSLDHTSDVRKIGSIEDSPFEPLNLEGNRQTGVEHRESLLGFSHLRSRSTQHTRITGYGAVNSRSVKQVSSKKAGNKVWLYMMMVTIGVGFGSVSIDRVICRYRQPNWLAVVWIFVACDLAFVFLFGFLDSSELMD